MTRDVGAFESKLAALLPALRAYPGIGSEASAECLRDVARFALERAEDGQPLIEIGGSRLGSTIPLAFLARRLGAMLYSIDDDRERIAATASLLSKLDLRDRVVLYHGDLPSFADEVLLPRQPVLALVAGGGDFQAVKMQLMALFRLSQRPRFAAFHGYAEKSGGGGDGEYFRRAVTHVLGSAPALLPVGAGVPAAPEAVLVDLAGQRDPTSQAFVTLLEEQLQALKAYPGFQGQMTNNLLAGVARTVIDNAEPGEPLIEFGCNRGKSTVALALLARRMDTNLYSVDTSRERVDFVARMLAHFGLADRVVFYLGDLPGFAKEILLTRRPALALVAGHTAYRDVGADIAALLSMNMRPRFAAFHSYSLRRMGAQTEDCPSVQRAIEDAFGPDLVTLPIGNLGPAGPPKVNERNNYQEPGAPEGVVIDLAPYANGLPRQPVRVNA